MFYMHARLNCTLSSSQWLILCTTEVVKSYIKKLCGGVFLFWEQMLHAVEPNQYTNGNFKMMFFHLSHDIESSIPKKIHWVPFHVHSRPSPWLGQQRKHGLIREWLSGFRKQCQTMGHRCTCHLKVHTVKLHFPDTHLIRTPYHGELSLFLEKVQDLVV